MSDETTSSEHLEPENPSEFRTVGFNKFEDAEKFLRNVSKISDDWEMDFPGRITGRGEADNWMQAIEIEVAGKNYWVIADSESDLPGKIIDPHLLADWLDFLPPFSGGLTALVNRETN
jgi:hypothetical protein